MISTVIMTRIQASVTGTLKMAIVILRASTMTVLKGIAS